MDLLSKKATKLSDDIKRDDTGQKYRETKWDYQGKRFGINVDLDKNNQPIAYHAKADSEKSASVNMDEGGLVGWFMRFIGK